MVIVDGQSTTGDNYDDISMYRAVDLIIPKPTVPQFRNA